MPLIDMIKDAKRWDWRHKMERLEDTNSQPSKKLNPSKKLSQEIYRKAAENVYIANQFENVLKIPIKRKEKCDEKCIHYPADFFSLVDGKTLKQEAMLTVKRSPVVEVMISPCKNNLVREFEADSTSKNETRGDDNAVEKDADSRINNKMYRNIKREIDAESGPGPIKINKNPPTLINMAPSKFDMCTRHHLYATISPPEVTYSTDDSNTWPAELPLSTLVELEIDRRIDALPSRSIFCTRTHTYTTIVLPTAQNELFSPAHLLGSAHLLPSMSLIANLERDRRTNMTNVYPPKSVVCARTHSYTTISLPVAGNSIVVAQSPRAPHPTSDPTHVDGPSTAELQCHFMQAHMVDLNAKMFGLQAALNTANARLFEKQGQIQNLALINRQLDNQVQSLVLQREIERNSANILSIQRNFEYQQ